MKEKKKKNWVYNIRNYPTSKTKPINPIHTEGEEEAYFDGGRDKEARLGRRANGFKSDLYRILLIIIIFSFIVVILYDLSHDPETSKTQHEEK